MIVRPSILLWIDAGINLALGTLLLVFPRGVMDALGVPGAASKFYPSILGAVLVGIGLALLYETRRPARRPAGLGLAGAVAINLCGGLALAGWLISGQLDIPPRGQVILWLLAVLLVVISGAELLAQSRRRSAKS
jgi:peptidoglycan/LPS O-acetylase OafA/YrhL